MHLEHLIPLWATILLFTPPLLLVAVMLVRRRRQRLAWFRRLLMVLLLLVVALRPATSIEGEQTERLNAEVLFVVDRTGSMNAEDYDGEQPRLDGVRADMREVMSLTEGARYGIIAFDSSAAQQLPLTTDAGAVEAWIDTLTTEPTVHSQGSNVDRPLHLLTSTLERTREENPDSYLLVYVLSDGENTDDRESESFSPAAGYVDGGAVLGYGTEEGGQMRAEGGPGDGEYITGPDGTPGLSRIDEEQLGAIAEQLGVEYLHRTGEDESLASTLQGIDLRPVPTTASSRLQSFEDWYWIPAIPLALLFIWELGAMTIRLPRHRGREDLLGGIGEERR